MWRATIPGAYWWYQVLPPWRCAACSASAERMQTNLWPLRADFTRDIALNYVKRGYHLLCRHAITLLLMPVAATVLVRFTRDCMQLCKLPGACLGSSQPVCRQSVLFQRATLVCLCQFGLVRTSAQTVTTG